MQCVRHCCRCGGEVPCRVPACGRRASPIPAARQHRFRDVDPHVCGAERAKVARDCALRTPLSATERGDAPPAGLCHAADKEDILALQFEAEGIVRQLFPAVEVLAHIIDDMPPGLDEGFFASAGGTK